MQKFGPTRRAERENHHVMVFSCTTSRNITPRTATSRRMQGLFGRNLVEPIYQIDFDNHSFCRSWKSPEIVREGQSISNGSCEVSTNSSKLRTGPAPSLESADKEHTITMQSLHQPALGDRFQFVSSTFDRYSYGVQGGTFLRGGPAFEASSLPNLRNRLQVPALR